MISNRSVGYLLLNLCPVENIVVSTEKTAIKKAKISFSKWEQRSARFGRFNI